MSTEYVKSTCEYFSGKRTERLAFKGMELYSWQNVDGDWLFSILFGTNRNKTIKEVKAFVMDISEIEDCFCNMPVGENIFWLSSAQDTTTSEMRTFPQPPDNIINEVKERAVSCSVNITAYDE